MDSPDNSVAPLHSFRRSATAIALARVIGTTATAINSFVLAHLLGPSGVGLVAVLVSIPTVVVIAANWGIQFAGVYHLGQRRYDKVAVVSSVTWIGLVIGLLLVLVGVVILPTILKLFPDASYGGVLLALIAILPNVLLLYFSEVAVGLHQLDVAVLARFLPGVLYFIGSLLLVALFHLEVAGAMIAYFSAITSASVLAFALLYWHGYIHFVVNWRFVREAFVFGTKSQLGDVAQYLVYRLDLPLVGHFAGLSAAGYYSVAVRLAEALWLPSDSIRTVLLARVSSNPRDAHDDITARLGRILLAVGGLVAVGIALFGSLLLSWLLPDYLPAIPLLLTLLPGVLAASVFRVLTGDIVGRGHPGLVARITLVGLAIALLMYFLLIPRYGALGAAVSSSILYLVEFFVAMAIVSKLAGLPLMDLVLLQRSDLRTLGDVLARIYRGVSAGIRAFLVGDEASP